MKDNIKIAEFMEVPMLGELYCPLDPITGETLFTTAQGLRYDTDWNWLMPVISKLEQMPEAYEYEEFLMVRDEVITGRIETTYQEVVNCIGWYKGQKQ